MMLGSGLLHPEPFLLTLDLLLAESVRLPQRVDFLNLGGGIGIPYRPGERPFDLPALARAISDRLAAHPLPTPRLLFECGRYILTPHGVLVTRVDPNSTAADKQIKPGEVIVEVGQEAVNAPADVSKRIDQLKKDGRKSVLLLVASASGDVRFVALGID